MAFVTLIGHYGHRVMTYGLVNSTTMYQIFMNEVFREYIHPFVIIYIDILGYSKSEGPTM